MAITLDEIKKDPEFQQLPFDNQSKILNGWYKDNVVNDPEYQSLSKEKQDSIHQNFENDQGIIPQPIPQPLPPPTEQEKLAKESTDYGFNLLTGTASEASKEALNLGRKTFEPFVAMPYQASKAITDPIAEAIQQRISPFKIPSQIENNLVDLTLGTGEYQSKPLGTADIVNMLLESKRQSPIIEDPYRQNAPQIQANRIIQNPYNQINVDTSFPQFREAWKSDPYNSALAVSPILFPIISRGAQEIASRMPEKEPMISPETRQAYTQGIQEIGQTLKNIPDEIRPQQAKVVADLRNQMRSALFKDDIATINSIVADFKEGQIIPTEQAIKPILNIPETNVTTLREKQAEELTSQKNIIQPTPEYNAEMAKITQQEPHSQELPDLIIESVGNNYIVKPTTDQLSVLKTIQDKIQTADKAQMIKTEEGYKRTSSGLPEYALDIPRIHSILSISKAINNQVLTPKQLNIVKQLYKGETGYYKIEPQSDITFPFGENIKTQPLPDAELSQTKNLDSIPSSISIGTKVRIGKSPQVWTIIKAHESTPEEIKLGEYYFDARNDKTGEISQNVQLAELKKIAKQPLFEGQKTDIAPIEGVSLINNPNVQEQQKLFQPKAGQLTHEQFQQQTSNINIGREGKPSIKSEAEIRYSPGTGINLETLDLPQNIKYTIYKLTQQYQPLFEETRNRKTWDEINKEAENLGFDANQLLERQKGEAYNAAKLKATKDIQNNTVFEAKKIADEAIKLATDNKLTEEQQNEVLAISNMKMKKAASILAQANGAYSEAGRALNILRQVSSASKAQKNWNAILDTLGGREMTLEMFKRISGMDMNAAPEVAKFIRDIQKARTANMVLEGWRNAILSGTKTLITNPLSNALTFASNPIETGIAATLEKGRSLITGKKPQIYFKEVPAEIVGAIDGIWNSMRVFLNTMKTEIPKFGETKLENIIQQTAIPGKIGRIIRMPQTILLAQDDAAKSLIYDSTLKALAVRYAIRKGIKTKEGITDFVGNLLTNPQGNNKKIFELFDKKARIEADYRTYNKELGKIGKIFMKLRDQEFPSGSGIKPLYYIIPFIRTPTNIVKYGLERTPLNFVRVGYKNFRGEMPNSQISEEYAKPILGSLMFLFGWLMYEYGYITGDAPKDKTDRESWVNAGKKSYSFYIPWLKQYIPYQRLQPLGSILGMIADFFENIHRGFTNTKDALSKILFSISRNWSNQTFLMGATNLINAYSDPERYGENFVNGLASSVIPNIISSFNPDPYYRQTNTLIDTYKSKIPGLSETLPPKRDIFGSPVKKGEERKMAIINQFLPFDITKPSNDPVRKELLRLNDSISFSVGMPNKYFRINKEKIDIPPTIYDAYTKESGELAYRLINEIIKGNGYEKMNDETKAIYIRKQFDTARDYIRPKYINQLRKAGRNG